MGHSFGTGEAAVAEAEVGSAVVVANDLGIEIGVSFAEEVAGEAIFGRDAIGEEGGPADDRWAFDSGDGDVSDATMREVGLEGEDVVTGLQGA